MNRGFNYYFREGVKSSASSLFKNRGLLKFFAWFFMELIGRLTIILNPVFSLAAVRQGEQVRLNKNLDLSQSFRDAGRPFSVWTYILTVMVEGLMILGGLLVIAVVAVILGLIGYAIGQFTEDINLVTLIFMIPAAVVALIYLIVMVLMFAPTSFVISNNPELGVADVLSVCFNTMKSRGKLTLVLSVLIPTLIVLVYLAAVGAVGYFIPGLIEVEQTLLIVIFVAWVIIAFIGFLFIASIFILASRSAVNHLFADIVTDPVAADMNTSGVNVLAFKGAKVTGNAAEDALVTMFDETEADTYALIGDIQSKRKKPAAPDASEFMTEVDLGSAIGYRKGRKKKNRHAEEQDEPLPTVSDVLKEEATAEEKEIKIPSAVEPALAGVEPSVERIIKDAENRAKQEQVAAEKADKQPAPAQTAPAQPVAAQTKPAPAQTAPAQPTAAQAKPAPAQVTPARPVQETDELEDELDEELDDGLDEPAEPQAQEKGE